MRRFSSFPFSLPIFPLIAITSTLILHALNPTAAALSPDGLALLAFKSAVSGDPSSALASWAEDDDDPCHWPGISCSNLSSSQDPNRVVAIAVSDKNLSGYIPSELGSLVFLRRLNLHGNRLSGSIPSQLFNATSLHSLFLYDNNLSGSIPSSICAPPRFQNLDLSRNSLSGPLPSDLRSCHELQRLFLSGNRLSGNIPAGIWPQMAGLVQLDISSNIFEGPLPSDIGDLNSLSGTLNLSNNIFSGPIPKSLGSLPPAVILDLRYNNFSGEIPQNGLLANQGPTAFLNNPGLCGFPLQIPCLGDASTAVSAPPGREGANREKELLPARRKGLRPGLIVLISMADAAGVAIVGLLLVYVYWRVRDRVNKNGCICTGKSKLGGEGYVNGRWRCGHCCRRGEASSSSDEDEDFIEESVKSSDNEAGEGKLVSMDKVEFKLDELLRASAYVLGKGGLGIVYKVVLGNGVPVAVRRLGEGGGQRYKEFAAEVHAIAKARHPNVVRLRAYYWAQDEKLLISDFISNGNLADALRGRSCQSSLSWLSRLRIAKGVARGLAYLHECSPRKFVHGDIKPSNILLDANHNPLISDFGLTGLISIASTSTTINVNDTSMSLIPLSSTGTGGFIGAALPPSASATRPAVNRPNSYKAPEVRLPLARPNQKWDVYSFGVVLLELLTGRQPEVMDGAVASPSSLTVVKVVGLDLVSWVRKLFDKARPLAEIVDPALLSEVKANEVVAAFHVALACTEADPELRPRMKIVSDNLDRIGQ